MAYGTISESRRPAEVGAWGTIAAHETSWLKEGGGVAASRGMFPLSAKAMRMERPRRPLRGALDVAAESDKHSMSVT